MATSQQFVENPTIFWISHALSAISLLGSIFNIFAVTKLKSYVNSLCRMVLILSILDLLLITSWIYMMNDRDALFMDNVWYFSWGSSIALTTCFANGLYITIKRMNPELIESSFNKYMIFSTIVGMTSCTIHILSRDPVQNRYNHGNCVMVLIVTASAIIYCIATYISVMKFLRIYERKTRIELTFYPLILIVCNFSLMTLHINYLITKTSNHDYEALANTISAFQGFLNAIVYGSPSKLFALCCKRRKIDPLMASETLEDVTHSATQSM